MLLDPFILAHPRGHSGRRLKLEGSESFDRACVTIVEVIRAWLRGSKSSSHSRSMPGDPGWSGIEGKRRSANTIVEAFIDEGHPCLGDQRFEIVPALATENAAHLKDIHEITVVGDLDDEMRLLAVKVLDLENVMKAFTLQDLLAMHEDGIDRNIQALAWYAAFHC